MTLNLKLLLLALLLSIFSIQQVRIHSLKQELSQEQLNFTSYKLNQANLLNQVTQQAHLTEQKLNSSIQDLKANHEKQLKASSTALNRLTLRLQASNSPTSTLPDSTTPQAEPFASGSYGSELPQASRELLGEAHRAEIIRLDLLLCYSSYETARKALEELSLRSLVLQKQSNSLTPAD